MWPRRAPRPGKRGRPCHVQRRAGPERDAVRSDDGGLEGWPHDDVATSVTTIAGSGGPQRACFGQPHNDVATPSHSPRRGARPTIGSVASVRVLWRCSAHTILPAEPRSRGAARTRDRFVAEGAPPRSPEARRRGEGPHHVALAWEGWPHDDVAKLSATCACGIGCGVADLRARSLKGGTSAPWAWRVNAGCWCGGMATRIAACCGAACGGGGAACRVAPDAAARVGLDAAARVGLDAAARVGPDAAARVAPDAAAPAARQPPAARRQLGELPRRGLISGEQAADSRCGPRREGHSSLLSTADSRCERATRGTTEFVAALRGVRRPARRPPPAARRPAPAAPRPPPRARRPARAAPVAAASPPRPSPLPRRPWRRRLAPAAPPPPRPPPAACVRQRRPPPLQASSCAATAGAAAPPRGPASRRGWARQVSRAGNARDPAC